jgi:ABC-type glycerol-3-phosphate transport system substrate-binding protein
MLRKTKLAAIITLIFFVSFPAWGGGKPDVKGMEIIIGNWWDDYDTNTWKPRNEAQEILLAQRKKLMQENGVVIREKMLTDWNGMQQKAVVSTMSGKPDAHVFLLQANWAMAMRARGLLAPLDDSKIINIRNPQPVGKGYLPVEFNQSVIDSFTFDGKAYAFSIGLSVHNFDALFFNKRLFREAGLDPNLHYDMQKAGT